MRKKETIKEKRWRRGRLIKMKKRETEERKNGVKGEQIVSMRAALY